MSGEFIKLDPYFIPEDSGSFTEVQKKSIADYNLQQANLFNNAFNTIFGNPFEDRNAGNVAFWNYIQKWSSFPDYTLRVEPPYLVVPAGGVVQLPAYSPVFWTLQRPIGVMPSPSGGYYIFSAVLPNNTVIHIPCPTKQWSAIKNAVERGNTTN